MKANPDPPPCWGGLLICIYPVLIVFSILVQCFITAWRVDHRQRAQSRRRHVHHRASSRPRETREEARQRKYRYLYQVRTARGDIISQVSGQLDWYDTLLWLTSTAFLRYVSIYLALCFCKCKYSFNIAKVAIFIRDIVNNRILFKIELIGKFNHIHFYSVELRVGFAEARATRISAAIGALNQNQFART